MVDERTADEETTSAGSGPAGPWPRSVAVIGAAGLIGSGVAERLAENGQADDLYLVDLHENLVRAHAIDIAETQVIGGNTRTRLHIGAPEDGGEVDLVILAASIPEVPDGDRRDFLAANLRLLGTLTPLLESLAGGSGIVLILSNPVDILADCLAQTSGIDPDRICGYSLNDTVRFRIAVARELGADVNDVEALMLGEHGGHQVPLFETLTLKGAPVRLEAAQQERVMADVNGWFARWSALKPGRSTGWATPAGVSQIVQAMAEGQVHPAAVWTGGVSGMPGTFMALPAAADGGRLAARPERLPAGAMEGLRAAAGSVAEAARAALAAVR
jgi:malate dehydrogenase